MEQGWPVGLEGEDLPRNAIHPKGPLISLPVWVLQKIIIVYAHGLAHLRQGQQVPGEVLLRKTPPVGGANHPTFQLTAVLLGKQRKKILFVNLL